MVANAEALANGADKVVCEIGDVTFRQGAGGTAEGGKNQPINHQMNPPEKN